MEIFKITDISYKLFSYLNKDDIVCMSLTNTFLLATVARYLQFEATKCLEKCKKSYYRILGIFNEEDIYELLLQLSDEASEAHQLPLLIDRLTPAEIFSLI